MRTFSWVKACTCHATATTGEIRLGGAVPTATGFIVPAELHPGPSCDACGTPWVRQPDKVEP